MIHPLQFLAKCISFLFQCRDLLFEFFRAILQHLYLFDSQEAEFLVMRQTRSKLFKLLFN